MNAQQRADYVEEFVDERMLAVLADKGRSYSRGEEDVNSNFKRVAEAIGITPIQAAFVYLLKHMDAITHFVKSGEESSEGIESNLGDAANYLVIIGSLARESVPQEYEKKLSGTVTIGKEDAPWGMNKLSATEAALIESKGGGL
jgi:hypothetical protein